MRKLLVWNTRVGSFYIAEHEGRFHPTFDDESLGSYASIEQAVDDLSCGHAFWVRGTDTSILGIPDDPAEWHRV